MTKILVTGAGGQLGQSLQFEDDKSYINRLKSINFTRQVAYFGFYHGCY